MSNCGSPVEKCASNICWGRWQATGLRIPACLATTPPEPARPGQPLRAWRRRAPSRERAVSRRGNVCPKRERIRFPSWHSVALISAIYEYESLQEKRRRCRFDAVADCTVPLQSALEHSCQHREAIIHVIIDLNDALAVVETMQAANILLQGPLPGDRHGQKQRIQPRVVESLTDIAPCGQNQP